MSTTMGSSEVWEQIELEAWSTGRSGCTLLAEVWGSVSYSRTNPAIEKIRKMYLNNVDITVLLVEKMRQKIAGKVYS